MKIRLIAFAAAFAVISIFAAEITITSSERNGIITWSNSLTNAVYQVQWSNSVTGAWTNFQSLAKLDSIETTNQVVTAQVPVFYRVAATSQGPSTVHGAFQYEGYDAKGALIVVGWLTLLPDPTLENRFYGDWALGWVGGWVDSDPKTRVGQQIGTGRLIATQGRDGRVTVDLTPNLGNETVALLWEPLRDGRSTGVWRWVIFTDVRTNGTFVVRKLSG